VVPGPSWDQTPFHVIQPEAYFYFVHSYYVVPEDPSIVAATCEYARTKFTAALKWKNVFAVQFHPEKSGPSGLNLIRTWTDEISKGGAL